MFAVLYDEQATSWQALTAALPDLRKTTVYYGVNGGAALHKAVARLAAGKRQCAHTLNLCSGSDESGGVSAGLAALLLERAGVAYSGCRASLLGQPLDVLFMMTWYAGLPLPTFAVLRTDEEATSAAGRLRAPLRIRSTLPSAGVLDQTVVAQSDVLSTLKSALTEHGSVVAWEVPVACDTASVQTAHVLVSGGKTRGALAVEAPCSDSEPALREWAASFSKHVLSHRGSALLTFTRLSGDNAEGTAPSWSLTDFSLSPSAVALPVGVQQIFSPAALQRDMLADALESSPAPNYEVRLNADSRKGYSLCAVRAIRQGEIVFEDEGRSFAIVTRPHVESWSREDKKTFTEYAWPLDTEGHVYAIWEADPRRWRPLNHSCDPTCVFAAPHSLNVIAARDIAVGEDLSMDYAAFCDGTMSPFTCLCGASCCRGRIEPSEEALCKYGANAWLRRVPPPVKPLL